MKSLIFLIVANGVLIYFLWGAWDILFIVSVAFFYSYKKYLTEYADRMLK